VARADTEKGQPTVWEPEETWIEEAAEEPVPPPPKLHDDRTNRSRDLAMGRDGVPSPGGQRRKVPRPVVDELSAVAGDARGAKLAHRLADASYAYERERYQEARRILKPLVEEVPGSAAARELYGLVLYRSGQWAPAAKELEEFRHLTGSFDQHPVLADCYRAVHRYEDADQVWEDLRRASPNGDLVAEGRIVAAGCLADQGDLRGAISLLEKTARRVARPADRHLRQWYALADLYERAGDMPRARELFGRVASADPDAFDVRARLQALR
jgi:tetratricopeptide (TPR) repeat protein